MLLLPVFAIGGYVLAIVPALDCWHICQCVALQKADG